MRALVHHRPRVWALLPLALASAFVVGLVLRLRELVTTLHYNGDVASAPVIAELFGERDGSRVTLGDYRWLEPLFALRLTAWLPAHRQVWQLLPFAALALTVALAVWTVHRVAGRERALLALALLACPSAAALDQFAAINFHGHTVLHVAILAAAAVLFVELGAGWSRWRLALAALGLASVTALGASSDQLLLPTGIVPLALVGLVLWRLERIPGRVALALGLAALGATAGGLALVAWAEAEGIVGTGRAFQLTSLEQALDQLRLFVDDVVLLGHGTFGGELSTWPLVHYAMALVVLVVSFALLGRVARLDAAGLRALAPGAQALLVFWAAALVLLVLAFVSTTAPIDTQSIRYVLVAWPALVVLACLMAGPRTGARALAAFATAAAVVALSDLARGVYTGEATPFPRGEVTGAVARFVDERGLDHGYAGYWTAATTTYQTRFAARVYPVWNCRQNEELCPYYLHRIDAWYRPKPGVRTFLVTDAAAVAPAIAAPPKAWGAVETASFGQLTVYVYPYDVATRLSLPS